MLLCGVGAKPVAHLMQYHLLQWEVAKVKWLMNSNMTLTVLNLHQSQRLKLGFYVPFNSQGHIGTGNLHQKTPQGATTKIQEKRYERDIREIK